MLLTYIQPCNFLCTTCIYSTFLLLRLIPTENNLSEEGAGQRGGRPGPSQKPLAVEYVPSPSAALETERWSPGTDQEWSLKNKHSMSTTNTS